MRMREFIRQNRDELDEAIGGALRFTPKQATCQCPLSGVRDHSCGEAPTLNDAERERWILNDESLYRWARREGVPV